jgi:hypothetical protein
MAKAAEHFAITPPVVTEVTVDLKDAREILEEETT